MRSRWPPTPNPAARVLLNAGQTPTCPEQPPSDPPVKVEATQEHDLDGRATILGGRAGGSIPRQCRCRFPNRTSSTLAL